MRIFHVLNRALQRGLVVSRLGWIVRRLLAPDLNSAIIRAFPADLKPDVTRLAMLLNPPWDMSASKGFAVSCGGEVIHIPYRIYRPAMSEGQFAALSPVERSIAACWFSRHHDGYVRERFLRALPAFDSPWIIAYVVALSGEYVVELLNSIWERRVLFDVPSGFPCANAAKDHQLLELLLPHGPFRDLCWQPTHCPFR
jgi:hypothetical protein